MVAPVTFFLHLQHRNHYINCHLFDTFLGLAFGNVAFLDIATILWSLHPIGVDTALEQSSASLVKMCSIHLEDVVPVLFVNTGRLIVFKEPLCKGLLANLYSSFCQLRVIKI
jgi:hypothetical protein